MRRKLTAAGCFEASEAGRLRVELANVQMAMNPLDEIDALVGDLFTLLPELEQESTSEP